MIRRVAVTVRWRAFTTMATGRRPAGASADVSGGNAIELENEEVRMPDAVAEQHAMDAVAFPCLDTMQQKSLDGGPEPAYDRVVSGYKIFRYDQPFQFFYGGRLSQFELAYETWGKLNDKRDNAVLIHTGLSASSHAKSHTDNPKPGWWEKFIGPGLAVDTDKFFVICTNVLGGCYGSTGPSSVNPRTGQPYATTFPILSVFDMVHAQFHLLDYLKINNLHASVGSSLGGMQSLAAAALYPERVSRVVNISGAARSIPYSIALRYTQRRVLMSDPNFNKGHYYDGKFPFVGMKLAREIATISYRSGPEWEQRFGRRRASTNKPSFCPDFLIETYLDYQSERFCLQYDPNSLLYISKAMDLFDLSLLATPASSTPTNRWSPSTHTDDSCTSTSAILSAEPDNNALGLRTDFDAGMARIKAPALVIGVQSDLLFPVTQQREIAATLRKNGNKIVRYYELDTLYGHDTFLIDVDTVGTVVKGHLEDDLRHADAERPSKF